MQVKLLSVSMRIIPGHWHVVAGTVSKGSAHQVEMGIEVIVSLLPPNDPQIQISRTSYNILRGKPKVFFAKAGMLKEEKLSLKHVPA